MRGDPLGDDFEKLANAFDSDDVERHLEALPLLVELASDRADAVWSFACKYVCSENPDTREVLGIWMVEHLLENHWDEYFPRIATAITGGNKLLQDTLGFCWGCRGVMKANREIWEPLVDAQSMRGRAPALLQFLRDAHRFNGPWEPPGALDVHSRRFGGGTPLHLALVQNNAAAVDGLISAGAGVNARGEDGYTPLHWAVSFCPDVLQMLLNAGAEPRAVNDFGQTPLDFARRHKDDSVMRILSAHA
jgi:hypothetical protein